MSNIILRASLAGVVAASPALAEKGPEILDGFPEATPAVAMPYENSEAPGNNGFSADFTEKTGNWALIGSKTQNGEASVNTAQSDTNSTAQWCADLAIHDAPYAGSNKKVRVKGAKELPIFVNDLMVYDGQNHPTPEAAQASCPKGRDIEGRVERKTKRGQWVPNGPWTDVIINSNEGLNYGKPIPPKKGEEEYTILPVKIPYECMPGKNKRTGEPLKNYFRVALKETAHPDNIVKTRTSRFIDNRIYRQFKNC
ncbi:MAG TPA: hypothetical protein VD947_03910 [Patescibacteria group bacterium]|nr:hypothetical protein [Patescibacteria group bacterium]